MSISLFSSTSSSSSSIVKASPSSHPMNATVLRTSSDIVKLMKLNLAQWNSMYELRTGLKDTEWTDLGKHIQTHRLNWEKLNPGEFLRLSAEETHLPRTLHIFRTDAKRLFVIVLLKKLISEGTQGSPIYLALDGLTGELFAERTRWDRVHPLEVKLLKGQRGLMHPDIFRAPYAGIGTEHEEVFAIQKLYEDNLQNLILNGQKEQIDQTILKLNNLIDKIKEEIQDSEIIDEKSWESEIEDHFIIFQSYDGLHPSTVQRFVLHLEGFMDALKAQAALAGCEWNLDAQLENEFNEPYEKLKGWSIEAGKSKITFEEKIVIVEDMIWGLIAMMKAKIEHEDIQLENIVYERGMDGKIQAARIIDFVDAVDLESPDYEPDEGHDPLGDIKSVGSALSLLFFEKFGQYPKEIKEEDLPKSGTIEGIVYEMLNGETETIAELEYALKQLEEIKKSIPRDKDDIKKD